MCHSGDILTNQGYLWNHTRDLNQLFVHVAYGRVNRNSYVLY